MHHLPLTLILGLAMFGWTVSMNAWLTATGIGVILLLRVNAVVRELAAGQGSRPQQ